MYNSVDFNNGSNCGATPNSGDSIDKDACLNGTDQDKTPGVKNEQSKNGDTTRSGGPKIDAEWECSDGVCVLRWKPKRKQ